LELQLEPTEVILFLRQLHQLVGELVATEAVLRAALAAAVVVVTGAIRQTMKALEQRAKVMTAEWAETQQEVQTPHTLVVVAAVQALQVRMQQTAVVAMAVVQLLAQ
jgi:uncharacterized membrane protein YgdD (TMEM256/DUF423 family)